MLEALLGRMTSKVSFLAKLRVLKSMTELLEAVIFSVDAFGFVTVTVPDSTWETCGRARTTDIKDKLIHIANVKNLKYFKKTFLGNLLGMAPPSLQISLLEYSIFREANTGPKINKYILHMRFWFCWKALTWLVVGRKRDGRDCLCVLLHTRMYVSP